MGECNDLFITSTESCLLPIIDTVRPNRGPMEGGTRVTITGSNLGAEFSDIVQIRLIGSTNVISSLTGEEDSYILGQQVVCETELFDSTGDYILEVEIQRDTQTAVVESMFQVVQPMLSGVAPMYGPQSGGIEVVVSGSQLDSLGNVMTCLLPNFTSTTSNAMKSDIVYTVMIGAAPGPDFTKQQLTLTVRPDPVFLEDGSAIKDTLVDVDSLLRITVSLIIVK